MANVPGMTLATTAFFSIRTLGLSGYWAGRSKLGLLSGTAWGKQLNVRIFLHFCSVGQAVETFKSWDFAFLQFCWVGKATFNNIVLSDKTTCTLAGVRFCDWSGGLAISLKITIRYIISYLKVFTLNSISNKSFVARTFIISFIFIPFEDSTRCHRFSHQSHRQVERSQCTSQDRHLGSKYKRMKRKYLANNFTTQEHKVRLSHAPSFHNFAAQQKQK